MDKPDELERPILAYEPRGTPRRRPRPSSSFPLALALNAVSFALAALMAPTVSAAFGSGDRAGSDRYAAFALGMCGVPVLLVEGLFLGFSVALAFRTREVLWSPWAERLVV